MRSLSLMLTLVACGGASTSSAPASAPAAAPAAASATSSDPAQVVATVGDASITLADVDAKAASAIQKANQDIYDARARAVDELVVDKLVTAEAAKRGMSVEDLLKAEVDDKAAAPAESEIQSLYDQNAARMGGASLDEMRPRIVEFLSSQEKGKRMVAFTDELKKAASVKVMLDPPRVQVEVPAHAPRFGSPDAPVEIIEFSDFECPYCGRAADTVDQLKAKYGDTITVAFRHFPLSFHPNAQKAAEASICAQDQGKFWEYHDKLFDNQRALAVDQLKGYAGALGLDQAAFDTCLDSGKHAELVKADMEEGSKLGVQGTPGFFVNGRFLGGALPVEKFSEIIDDEVARRR